MFFIQLSKYGNNETYFWLQMIIVRLIMGQFSRMEYWKMKSECLFKDLKTVIDTSGKEAQWNLSGKDLYQICDPLKFEFYLGTISPKVDGCPGRFNLLNK